MPHRPWVLAGGQDARRKGGADARRRDQLHVEALARVVQEEALAAVVVQELKDRDVKVENIRAVDLDIPPGVETDDAGRPVTFNRVAGVIVTGNEDGAHHVINNLSGALNEFGYTIPGQAWTYWNRGPGPGPSYLESEDGREWSQSSGRAMASNLVAVASALAENPIPAPPS